MQDLWYGDRRDLAKWGILLELSRQYMCRHVLQILYYRPNTWGKIELGNKQVDIAPEVIRHFRCPVSVRSICTDIGVEVLEEEFKQPKDYLECIKTAIRLRSVVPGVVFLDPDIGLEPEGGNRTLAHVSSIELKEIWSSLCYEDLLVLYQHQDNRAGREWRDRKRRQFARVVGLADNSVRLAHAPEIAHDVAFYYAQRQ